MCLRAALDQYSAAVVAHDPKAAPLVVGFRQTENAINVPAGGGVWKSVTGLGRMQRRYFDPVSGQAGIRTICTAMFYPGPELAVPDWPPYEGNWPLPASIVPAPAPPRP